MAAKKQMVPVAFGKNTGSGRLKEISKIGGAAFAGASLVFTIFGGIALIEKIAGEGHLSATYLWTSLLGSFFFTVLLVYFFKKVYEMEQQRERVGAQHAAELATRHDLQVANGALLHEAGHEVRFAAAERSRYSWDNKRLPGLLGKRLVHVLLLHLGVNREFRVTVKQSIPDRKVKAIFRCPTQGEERHEREVVTWDNSVPMRRFHEGFDASSKKQLQWVHIPSVKDEPGLPYKYKKDLEEHGIRSILAFPLRSETLHKDGINFSKRLGFFSFDSPQTNAFAELFDSSGNEPVMELDVFFTIADALATIVMLQSSGSRRESDRPPAPQEGISQ